MSDIEKYDPQSLPQDYPSQGYPFYEPEPESTGPSFGDLVRMVLRRWYIILLIAMLGWSAGIPAVWYLVEEMYYAEGAIRVKPILTNIITGNPDRGEISNYQMYMNTQAELIRRDVILRRVEDTLRNEQLSVFPPGSNPTRVLRSLLENGTISVNPGKNTILLKISMKYPIEAEAEQVVNAFLTSYMVVDQANEAKRGGQKSRILEESKIEFQVEITRLQEDIKKLRKEYGMDDLTIQQGMFLAREGRLREEITTLEIKKIYLDAQLEFLKNVQSDTISASDLVTMRNNYINADLELQSLHKELSEEQKTLRRNRQLLFSPHPLSISLHFPNHLTAIAI